ncbi:MAG: hypothetical protein K6G80_10230 [Treponema sp.]|nr:hypothetical protein [Treponema sp.]
MKKSVSISAIVVIFLAELAGILGIVYLRYCMDFQEKLFDSTVGQVSEIRSDVEQIKSLLYKYEYNMVLVMTSPALTEDETLQNQMMKAMAGSSGISGTKRCLRCLKSGYCRVLFWLRPLRNCINLLLVLQV